MKIATEVFAAAVDFAGRAAETATTLEILRFARFTAKGGQFSSGPDWQSHVGRDGLLITGQNPASSAATAEALTQALQAA